MALLILRNYLCFKIWTIAVTDVHLFPVCSIYNEVVACLFRLGSMINSGRSVAVQTCQQIFLVHDRNALESKQKVWACLYNIMLLSEAKDGPKNACTDSYFVVTVAWK